MALALVTGATGFIGRHLVRALLARGDRVRCLVRPTSQLAGLDAPRLETVVGEVVTGEGLAAALAGVEVVYHLAGATLALTAADYDRVNRGGTRLLAAACAACDRPPVLVVVSSLAAAGPSHGTPRAEEEPPAPVSNYGRSKRAAEEELIRVAGRVPATVLRPPAVFGPGDRYILKLFRSVRAGVNLVPGLTPTRLSMIHVRDLAEAMILAAEQGRRVPPGGDVGFTGFYNVALHEAPTFADLGREIAGAMHCRPPWTVRVPAAVCWMMGAVGELGARLARRPAYLVLDKMREGLAGSWTCDVSRAERELGFRAKVGLREGLAETAAWYREQGWL